MPDPDTTSGIRKVLLATDLSPTSELAAAWALDVAHDRGAELLVVSVIDPADRSGKRVDQVRERREAAVGAIVARGRDVGVAVSFLIWNGDPGESVVAAATAEGADLVVVGSHGRGPIGRLILGSVSDHVVRHAPCPVLVVRANEASRQTLALPA